MLGLLLKRGGYLFIHTSFLCKPQVPAFAGKLYRHDEVLFWFAVHLFLPISRAQCRYNALAPALASSCTVYCILVKEFAGLVTVTFSCTYVTE